MHAIDVAACGWEFSGAAAPFYPPDLPAEWRLGYYANEFSAVVVPTACWQSASAAELARWGSEVDDRFRFYWELPHDAAACASRLCATIALLRGQSGGIILDAPPSPELRALLQPLALPLGCWPQGGEVTAVAGLAVARGAAPARAVRAQLEQMTASAAVAAVVVCDTIDALRQAKLVAELLGVSRSG